MKVTRQLPTTYLSCQDLRLLLATETQLELSATHWQQITQCRDYLEQQLADTSEAHYGINTGFGALCHVRIAPEEIEQLQHNLIQSHACGMGDEVPEEVVRIMLLLKIISLSKGFSGVRTALVERLVYFYNHQVYPVIYELGSLGASGDLAPLAHLGLPLIGKGEVRVAGQKMTAEAWYQQVELEPLHLQAKEGLAILNGTQFSTAYGIWSLLEAQRLAEVADGTAALSIDGFHCLRTPFDAKLHQVRPYAGQQTVAANILHWLAKSDLQALPKAQIQDPYAFRCVPQVHGASRDAIAHVEQQLLTEVNSVTDNPTIFPIEEAILSGGNFHAQPVALVMDYLAIALAELGSISERRTYQLISGQRGLPTFLIHNPGLHSGLMIPQYVAAAIASQNKQLCTPASIDSIISSNGQEDHVSMAANAGTKLYRVVQNVARLLAIEWITAAQAIEFRRPSRTSPALEASLERYRQEVPELAGDRVLYEDLERTVRFLRKSTPHSSTKHPAAETE
ncbi:MAG: histidine ammonia-lyase [Bacteroidota bacterium]